MSKYAHPVTQPYVPRCSWAEDARLVRRAVDLLYADTPGVIGTYRGFEIRFILVYGRPRYHFGEVSHDYPHGRHESSSLRDAQRLIDYLLAEGRA